MLRHEPESSRPQCRDLPFSIHILDGRDLNLTHSSRGNSNKPTALFPASYRDRSDDLVATAFSFNDCIEKELDIDRLSSVQKWLWVAGLPLPPRALHHQLLLGREITITEQMDMHLVWTTGRMFLKPLPRFLLDPDVWVQNLGCEQCRVSVDTEASRTAQHKCKHIGLRRRALRFLFSYAALVSHESDFLIAKEKHLLPIEITWSSWCTLVDQLETKNIFPYVDHRFYHGELRLSRLNKIYALYQTPFHGYMARWNQYTVFFHDNFTWLASVTVYIAVVLGAMQVGLATNALKDNNAFQSASYGFTVFAICGPLIGAFSLLLLFCYVFIFYWARAHHEKRIRYSKLDPMCNL
ncbi:unnamed protein product [Penicillium salamii]|nr:unnamed protein product [Penicillium salamii]CAG8296130.1 unnamed protein product [Penicillium salamii]